MSIPTIISVNKSPTHTMTKFGQEEIVLIEGIGVEGDAHSGKLVKHRSRTKANPVPPNLRQVHLIHSELFKELEEKGFSILPGQMGENITTHGINLLNLPTDTVLTLGKEAKVRITGLRNPCSQLDGIKNGLMKAVLDKDEDGNLIRKAGVMGIVLTGGTIKAGDKIEIEIPNEPHLKLQPV